MSSIESTQTESAHNSLQPIISGKEDEPKIDYKENNQKLVENNSEEMTQNKCEAEAQLQLSPPPRRKLGRMALMRKTSKEQFACDQNEICDTLRTNDNQNSNDQNDRDICVTISDKSKLENNNESLTSDAKKSELLKESASDRLSSDRVEKQVERSFERSFVRTNSKADNNAFSQCLMDRIRRWKTRWITSEAAKATRRRRLNRFLYFVRVFLAHLFSTTGLCLLVVAYVCMGALIFKFLESKNEVKQRHDVQRERIGCAYDLWNFTITLNVFYEDKWKQATIERLKQFEERIVRAVNKDGYGGTNVDQWTFSGALLYSVTVITTIGSK
jgi:hypothetical protein